MTSVKDRATTRNIDQHAQEADRRNVPADVICVIAEEVASDSGDGEASVATTESGDSSTDHEVPLEGSSSSPLAEDLEQYELMKAAYLKVGQDFDTQEELLGEGYDKLLRFETVPRRWPLARLSIPLQRIVFFAVRCLRAMKVAGGAL